MKGTKLDLELKPSRDPLGTVDGRKKTVSLSVVMILIAVSAFQFAADTLSPSSSLARSNALLDSQWVIEGNKSNTNLGYSVASAGDVNGDGYSDVIVGANNYDNNQTDEGGAFVYLGSATGLSTSPSWAAESDQAYARFGNSVASAGDVNNDGYDDVLVGAQTYDNGQTDEGRAYLYLGSSAGLSPSPSWIVESDTQGAFLGSTVSSAGDVNNDGFDDVLVAVYYYTNGETYEGAVFLYLGSSSGPSSSPSWIAEGNQALAWFGRSAASAGDVNNDGFDDVVIGAYYYDNGEVNEGMAFLYLGSASGLSTSPSWTGEGNQRDAWFGSSVSSAGDVNRDGYDDVLIGAAGYDNPESYEGRAYLFLGSAIGLVASPAWIIESDQANAYLGPVSSAGDVNGDGYDDVMAGAYLYTNDDLEEGRVFVYLGSSTGLSATPAWIGEGNQYRSYYGISVSSAGDVNNDGYDEIIVGAPGSYDIGQIDEGRAFVYYGIVQQPTPVEFDLVLVTGWNFVTLPLVNHGYKASTMGLLFGDLVVGWNASTQTYDRSYIVGLSPSFNDFDIVSSEGYWIYASASETLTFTGYLATETQCRFVEVKTGGGWSVIGFASFADSFQLGLNASDVPSMLSGGNATVVVSYSSATQTYTAYVVGVPVTDFPLTAGHAYWVWLDSSVLFCHGP